MGAVRSHADYTLPSVLGEDVTFKEEFNLPIITPELTLDLFENGSVVESVIKHWSRYSITTALADLSHEHLQPFVNSSDIIIRDQWNVSEAVNGSSGTHHSLQDINWWALGTVLIVLLTALGNILVILAISWDRRLQNMTNYFLMSLAVTDLMVAVLVMPVAIVVLMLGWFPFSSELCLLWISLDVLFCSASIMHLCTISVDRFLSLRYPMKFGRYKTRRRVVLKLVLVWCLSLATSLPLSLMYATDSKSTIVDGVCQIPVSLFQIIGSVFCFYIPLVIMLITYALTVRLLSKKQSELMATGSDIPLSKLSKSMRLKHLLCKTTSTLSTTTSTIDTDLSEAMASDEGDLEIGSCRRNRLYTSPYRGILPRPRLPRDRDKIESFKFAKGSPGRSESCFSETADSESSVSMSTSPSSLAATPRKIPRSNLRNRHMARAIKESVVTLDSTSNISVTIFETESPVKKPSPDRKETEPHMPTDSVSSSVNGITVAFPCSCAPRFFLEGFQRKDSQPPACEECSHFQSSDFAAKAPQPHANSCKRGSRAARLKCIFTSVNCLRREEEHLKSPFKEEGSLKAPHNIFLPKSQYRSDTSSPYHCRSRVDTPTYGSPHASNLVVGLESSSPGSKHLWRTRSCGPSMRFVSSKRHGRNLHVEQKATKVLGIVFFTFVILWAPFFVINIVLGSCSSCASDISDDVITFVTWLGYTSSTVNPFFYTFFNKTFRESFVNIIKCRMKRNRKFHM